jgi:hypothetical protein
VASIKLKCEQLGLNLAEDSYPGLLAEIKKLAISKRRLVTDEEFGNLVGALSKAA